MSHTVLSDVFTMFTSCTCATDQIATTRAEVILLEDPLDEPEGGILRRALRFVPGLPRRLRIALLAVATPVLVLVLLPSLVGADRPLPAGEEEKAGALPSPSDQDPPGGAEPVPASWRSYALPFTELHGLPPDPRPGTRLELWVMWEPPVTKGPRTQKLPFPVAVERVAPAFAAGAPPTVILAVPGRGISDLIFSDRFGALSVVQPGPGGP